MKQNNHFVVDTAAQCQTKCQEHSECIYFQYVSGKDCYLKNEKAINKVKHNDQVVFGPKYCDGMMHNIFNRVFFL